MGPDPGAGSQQDLFPGCRRPRPRAVTIRRAVSFSATFTSQHVDGGWRHSRQSPQGLLLLLPWGHYPRGQDHRAGALGCTLREHESHSPGAEIGHTFPSGNTRRGWVSCCLLGLPGLWAPSSPLDTDHPGPRPGPRWPCCAGEGGLFEAPCRGHGDSRCRDPVSAAENSAGGRKWPGLIASFSKKVQSVQELESCCGRIVMRASQSSHGPRGTFAEPGGRVSAGKLPLEGRAPLCLLCKQAGAGAAGSGGCIVLGCVTAVQPAPRTHGWRNTTVTCSSLCGKNSWF